MTDYIKGIGSIGQFGSLCRRNVCRNFGGGWGTGSPDPAVSLPGTESSVLKNGALSRVVPRPNPESGSLLWDKGPLAAWNRIYEEGFLTSLNRTTLKVHWPAIGKG